MLGQNFLAVTITCNKTKKYCSSDRISGRQKFCNTWHSLSKQIHEMMLWHCPLVSKWVKIICLIGLRLPLVLTRCLLFSCVCESNYELNRYTKTSTVFKYTDRSHQMWSTSGVIHYSVHVRDDKQLSMRPLYMSYIQSTTWLYTLNCNKPSVSMLHVCDLQLSPSHTWTMNYIHLAELG